MTGISVRAVTRRLGTTTAVDALSLDIEPATFLVILGPSGSGKTTLIRLIAGLEAPDSGEIWMDGRQVAAGRRCIVPAYARRVGYVFQDLALWPHLTVDGHLRFVLAGQAVPKKEHPARIAEARELARIPALGSRLPHQLSGGEQQRLALARALVGHPRVLLLDEPLSSLDPDLRAALREELLALHRSTGLTAVYVTHDREDAAVLPSRLVTMAAGRIVSPVQGGLA